MALLSVSELKANYGEYLLLDARFRLNDPVAGRELFLQEHLPKAQFVDLETELSGEKNGKNGRHPLPSREDLKKLFGRLGVREETKVVVYDDADHAGAARAWMLLQWMGHASSWVLDGGLIAWKKCGFPVEGGEALEPWPAEFPDRSPLVKLLAKDHLEGRRLVDARAPERYRGEVEPLDPRAGHIPGAENLFYKNLLAGERFRSKEELETLLPKEESVFYCGSGVTAAVPLLASHELGRKAALYPGSWSEWCADPKAPVEVGAYRRGVMAVIQNSRGEVLLFERSDHAGSWQFPQGGIEGQESEEEALHRELREEIGLEGAKVIRKGAFSTTYEWPRPSGKDHNVGQRHTWFLCEVSREPQLEKGDGSFKRFAWKPVAEALSLVVPFKRASYEKGIESIGL